MDFRKRFLEARQIGQNSQGAPNRLRLTPSPRLPKNCSAMFLPPPVTRLIFEVNTDPMLALFSFLSDRANS